MRKERLRRSAFSWHSGKTCDKISKREEVRNVVKLRKMLGKVDDPSVVAMMSVIETQSVQTLAAWATDYN